MSQNSKYSIQVFWSDEDCSYIATSEEFPNLSAFGDTREEALNEAIIVLNEFLKEYDLNEIPAPSTLESFSGQFRLRLPRTLHRRLTNLASMEGVSLNTLIISMLSQTATHAVLVNEVLNQLFQRITYEIKGVDNVVDDSPQNYFHGEREITVIPDENITMIGA